MLYLFQIELIIPRCRKFISTVSIYGFYSVQTLICFRIHAHRLHIHYNKINIVYSSRQYRFIIELFPNISYIMAQKVQDENLCILHLRRYLLRVMARHNNIYPYIHVIRSKIVPVRAFVSIF